MTKTAKTKLIISGLLVLFAGCFALLTYCGLMLGSNKAKLENIKLQKPIQQSQSNVKVKGSIDFILHPTTIDYNALVSN